MDIRRQSSSLGLRVMGGIDHPLHVFRQGDKPGIFILQILEESAASKVGKLWPGDRILQVRLSYIAEQVKSNFAQVCLP